MSLEINNVKKSFDNNLVIKGISLSINSGEFISLVGPSGCGKTTLLRLISGLETPNSGEIHHGDKTFFSLSSKVNLSPAKRELGMVFQDFALWPHMSVFENVAYPLRVKKQTKNLKEKVLDALKDVHLESFYDRKIHQLSGGQQQRVSLARAIISKASIILMDEPLSALDATLRDDMRILIQKLIKRHNMTAIFVTHDQYEAMIMSDKIAMMTAGEIIQFDTPENLYHHPNSKEVAQFLGNGKYLEGNISNGILKTIKGLTIPVSNDFSKGKYGYLLRPEFIKVAEDGNTAIIETASFTGNQYQYTSEVSGETITFFDRAKYEIGNTVQLALGFEKNNLFKLEEV